MNRKVLVFLLLLGTALCRPAAAEEPAIDKNNKITVYLTGEVNQKGKQILAEGATILDAFTAAGGGTEGANLKMAVIYRKSSDGKTNPIRINLKEMLKGVTAATFLQNRDIVKIPRIMSPIIF